MKYFNIKVLSMAAAIVVLFSVCSYFTFGAEEKTSTASDAYTISTWLAKNGISIDRDIIDLSHQTVTEAVMENTLSDRTKSAEAMLGENAGGRADTYTSAQGTVVFNKDAFELTAKSGLLPDIISGVDIYNAGKKAEKAVKLLGFDLHNGSMITAESENGRYTATIIKTVNSKPVFDDNIVVVMDKRGVVSASGVWYNAAEKGKIRSAKSAADALTELLNQKSAAERITVTTMTLGYKMAQDDGKTVIVPVWRFEIEGRDDIYIDA